MNSLFIKHISIEQPLNNVRYYAVLPAVRALCETPLTLRRPVTFLVGENGVGKSTLLEAIAIALGFNPEGGSKNFNFSTADSHADLYRFLRIAKGVTAPRDGYFLRAESFYNVASHIDELDRSTMMGPPSNRTAKAFWRLRRSGSAGTVCICWTNRRRRCRRCGRCGCCAGSINW